ncbi:MAG: DUF3365 domain-containing protein, partial [Candidatus Latescibacterota bacterium]
AARTALGSYKKALQAALREGLRDGPENAIDVCRSKAPEIGRAVAGGGMKIGRTSHRLRNPANEPAPWVKPFLDAYAAGEDNSPWRAVRLDDGAVGYVEPIFVQPLCLKCHGAAIPDGVAEKITQWYPDDQATNFSAGDFRGLFWVTIAPASPDG